MRIKHDGSLFSSRSAFGLAGWLFADLLLGLSMVFLAASLSTPFVSNTITLTATITPTETPTSTPQKTNTTVIMTRTASATNVIPSLTTVPTSTIIPSPSTIQRIGLETTPVIISISVSPEDFLAGKFDSVSSFKNKADRILSQYKDRRVGLVITLGYHDEVRNGVRLAAKANQVLASSYPHMFDNAVTKEFWYSLDTNHPAGTIVMEVYLYTNVTENK